MTIGERIKLKREEKDWTQRDLASKMKYSNHSTVGKIERGKVDIPQSRIVQFAEVLGTSVAYLMGWEEEAQKNDPLNCVYITNKEKELLSKFNSLPTEKQTLIMQLIEQM